MRFTD